MLGKGIGLLKGNLTSSDISRIMSSLKKRGSYFENKIETNHSLNSLKKCDILKKASILITPTSYSDGILHTAKPIPKLGPELVTNGSFENGSNHWSLQNNWSVSNGKAVGSNTNGYIYQNIGIESGKVYKFMFKVVEILSGNIKAVLNGGSNSGSQLITQAGFYTFFLSTQSPNQNASIEGSSFTGSIDNISVKEVVSEDLDFLRGSLATRTNEQGNNESLSQFGPELVLNGDFEDLGPELIINRSFENGSGWSNGSGDWVIANGFATANNSNNVLHPTVQFGSSNGVKYILEFTLSDVSQGYIRVGINISLPEQYSVDGSYSLEILSTGNNHLYINPNNFSGKISNLSVKRVDPNSRWNTGSTWSVSDEKAIHVAPSGGFLSQQINLQVGKNYMIYSDVEIGNIGLLDTYYNSNGLGVLSPSNNTVFFSTKNTDMLYLYSTEEVSLNSISIKEVIEVTNIPRINFEDFTGTKEVYGDELITNRDFATDSDWIKPPNLSISNGKAIANGVSSEQQLWQTFNTTGKYKVEFTISNYVNGGLSPIFDGGTFSGESIVSENGTFTQYLTVTSNPSRFSLKFFESSSVMDVDNVSVKEVKTIQTGGKGHILLEGQATNLTEYSNNFSNSYWAREGQATIEANAEISPTGSLNASYLKAGAGEWKTPRITQTFTASLNKTYVGSVFVKKDNIDFIRLLTTGTGATVQAYYNVSNGTLGVQGTPSKAKIEDYGNGWYRLSLVIDSVNSTSSATFRVQISKADGNGVSNFDGTEKTIIFGAQLEEGLIASTYIPSDGGVVTRLAETLSKGGLSSLINSEQGVLYADFAANVNDSNYKEISISDGTSSNRIEIRIVLGVLGHTTRNGGIESGSGSFTPTSVLNFNKIALQYIGNQLKFYVNGSLVANITTNSAFNANTFSFFNFNSGAGSSPFFGKCKAAAVFKQALTDSELQCLTQVSI